MNKLLIRDKNPTNIMADSIENLILNKLKKCGRGTVYFIGDFIAYGTRNSVNKALERLTAKGVLLRVARGIYCYPKIEKAYALGPIPPTIEDIAEAMAKRDGAKIIPSGLFAQYQLGLSQQIPTNVVYLTNGISRTIKISSGQAITFKHSAPRYFTIRSKLAILLTTALKDWKIENLSPNQIESIKLLLNSNPRLQASDLKLMTAEVRELISSLYDE